MVLQQKYALATDDILLHMEAFLSNNSLDVLTLEVFGRFEQDIHREKSKVAMFSISQFDERSLCCMTESLINL